MDFGQCHELFEHLKSGRDPRYMTWLELSRWLCPWRGVFSGWKYDEQETRRLFTHAAGQAALMAASGMTSGMTPRNVAWFRPMFSDEQLMEVSGARQWLDETGTRMQDALVSGGFYQAIQNFNLDLIWAGCALLYSEKDDPIRYECVQVGTFAIALGQDGKLDAVAREITMSAAECARQFGEGNLLESTRKLAKEKPWQDVQLCQLCRREDGSRYPVRSWWWQQEGEKFLRESGYYEMPYFYAVWNEGTTPYGTGPGDRCLADAMQMDSLERNKLEGIQKIVNPPVSCPPQFKDIVNLDPGGINYSLNPNDMIRPILDLSPYASSLGNVQAEIEVVRKRLEEGLMATIFSSVPLEQRPAGMSATEFLERKREAMQQLGPVISAYEPNVLAPLLYRTVRSLDRAGLGAIVPPTLAQIPIYMKMEFISPMANALRQTGAETARALFSDVATICQATQSMEAMDKIDVDQLVDELAKGLGAPGAIVRADDDVAALRKQRAEQQQAAQQAQMQQQMQMFNTEQMVKLAGKVPGNGAGGAGSAAGSAAGGGF